MKKQYVSPQYFTERLETLGMLALSKSGEYQPGQQTLAPGLPNGRNDDDLDEEEDEEDW